MISIVDVILLAAVLAIAGYLYFGLYQSLRVDVFRERVFCIRDQFMRDAPSLGIGYSDPSYVITRTMLNGTIRYAHELSLMQVVILVLTNKFVLREQNGSEYQKMLSTALQSLPQQARDRVLRAHAEAHWAAISHILHTSWLLAPLVLSLKLALRAVNLLSFASTPLLALANRPSPIDREAYLLGGR